MWICLEVMRLSPEITCQNLLACLFCWTILLATFFSLSLLFNILKDELSLEEALWTPLCWHRSTRATRDSCVPGKKGRAGLFLNIRPQIQAPAALQLQHSQLGSRLDQPACGKEPSSASPDFRHRVQSAELQPHQHNHARKGKGVLQSAARLISGYLKLNP